MIPSVNDFSLVSSLQEAIAHCIKKEHLAKIPWLRQDLENISSQDLIHIIHCLQEENQQLKQVYELRMAEVLKILEGLTGHDKAQKNSTRNLSSHTHQVINHLKQNIREDLQENEKLSQTLDAVNRQIVYDETHLLQKLKESEEQFRIIFENSRDLICLLQADGTVLYTSPSVKNILGYTHEDITGTSYLNLIHPEDLHPEDLHPGDFHPGEIAAFLIEKNRSEIRIRKKDGQFIWMEVNGRKITGIEGQPDKILLSSRNVTEIKEIIERLTESQEQLSSTFSSIDDDVYVFDRNHKLIASNVKPNKVGLLSKSYTESYGKSFYEILPDNLSHHLETALNHLAESREVQQFEHCLSDHLFSLYYKISVNYRQDSDDRYAGFTMVVRDITEEKITDKKIIESEKKYRSVVESVREVIFQADHQGRLSFLNPAWKAISGYDIFASIEQPIVNFIYQDDQQYVSTLLENILQGKRDEAKCEVRFVSKQQDIFWAETFIKVYLDDSGEIAGISGTLSDITKRKEAEKTLRQNNRLLESINKNIKESILRVDAQGSLMYFNQAFLEMFGYESKEEIEHLPLQTLFAQQEDLGTYMNILNNQEAFTNKPLLFRRKDRSTFWGLSSFIMIQDEHNHVFYDGAIRDITDRKEAEKKLQEKNLELIKTNEELDRFVYSASHDLRAPLASTLGLINISRISPDEKERTYYLDLMEQSLHRMDKIIQDLTDYSRNARLEVETEEIDFKSMIKDVLQRLKYLKNIDDVDIRTEIKTEDSFYSDKIRLYVIMINLISNAIKYHKYDHPNPFIEINITIDSAKAVIRVADNGIGIDKNHIDKIFTMFFQVARDSIGSGLGLYIVKETVNKLQGSIEVNSVLSNGSAFSITLPNAKTFTY